MLLKKSLKIVWSSLLLAQLFGGNVFASKDIEIALNCNARHTPVPNEVWSYKHSKPDITVTDNGWTLRSCSPAIGSYTHAHDGERIYNSTAECLWVKDFSSFESFTKELDNDYTAHHEGPTGLISVSKTCFYDKSNFHLVFEQIKELEDLKSKVEKIEERQLNMASK